MTADGPRDGSLSGRVALVAGAGQTPGETIGNGRATAILLARRGALVATADRDLARAKDTVDAIESDGGKAIAIELDVTNLDSCESAVADVAEREGRLDILHHNVGIGTGDAGATSIEPAAWQLIHDVNLTAAWHTSRAVLPHMREAGSGVITHVSSAAAVCSTPFLAYKTSKAAMNAMVQQLALSNARFGIRVNAIMPGLIDTPMAIEGISEATGISRERLRTQRDDMVPLSGRMGTAWDVAHAAAFLASDEAAFITGIALAVDGGQSARVG